MSHCDTCVSQWGKYLAIPLLSTVWYFSHYSDVCCGHIRPFCFRLKPQNVWSWLLLPSSGKSMERSLCGPLGGTDISKYVWRAVDQAGSCRPLTAESRIRSERDAEHSEEESDLQLLFLLPHVLFPSYFVSWHQLNCFPDFIFIAPYRLYQPVSTFCVWP